MRERVNDDVLLLHEVTQSLHHRHTQEIAAVANTKHNSHMTVIGPGPVNIP